jgi:AcrR family transcriptional regulator
MGRKTVKPEDRKYKKPDERKAQILDTAFALADTKGLKAASIAAVAREIGVTGPLVIRYIGKLENLREAITARAVKVRHVNIIADLIELKSPLLATVPDDLKTEAGALLATA